MPALHLRSRTSEAWLAAVLGDFDAFLLDHAACERKASANALSLAVHYPDRRTLVRAMIELAREELDHFQQVYDIVDARGLRLTADRKDPYLRELLARIRRGADGYFLDRLLVAGVAEARGCERFGLIAAALKDPGLRDFYSALSRSEARHGELFVELARSYFEPGAVTGRLEELLEDEALVVAQLPVCAALH